MKCATMLDRIDKTIDKIVLSEYPSIIQIFQRYLDG
jgi:hypothetical protein